MENTQLSLFGKTSPEHSQVTKARTSASSSKSSLKSLTRPYLYLRLQRGNGRPPEAWTETAGPLPGAQWMPNTTESPNVAVESYLSQILQVNVPEKYHLSAKACLGILRRAEKRGKQLPPMLKEALEQTIERSGLMDITEMSLEDGVSSTLQTKGPGAVCYGISSYESNSMKSDNPHSGVYVADTSRTLDLNGGNPACNQGGIAIVEPVCIGNGQADIASHISVGVAQTLNCMHDQMAIIVPTYTLKIRSGCEGGGKGPLVQTDKSATLATNNDQYLFQPVISMGHDARSAKFTNDGKTDPLTATDYKDPQVVAYEDGAFLASGHKTTGCLMAGPGVRGFSECQEIFTGDYHVIESKAFTQSSFANYSEGFCTVRASGGDLGGGSETLVVGQNPRYIVRRLTPTECARLQGFPDWWGHVSKKDDFTEDEFNFWNDVYVTHQLIVNGKEVQPKTKPQLLTWYNKLWTDSAEYKMWGNGVALPCVRVPIHNMAKHGAKTLASLFDGSGGFPLAGVLEGITPVWCSEIEPYPIAVTVERFPEPEDDWMD